MGVRLASSLACAGARAAQLGLYGLPLSCKAFFVAIDMSTRPIGAQVFLRWQDGLRLYIRPVDERVRSGPDEMREGARAPNSLVDVLSRH